MIQYSITYLILSAAIGGDYLSVMVPAIALGSPLPTQFGMSNTKGGDLMSRSPSQRLIDWHDSPQWGSFFGWGLGFNKKSFKESDKQFKLPGGVSVVTASLPRGKLAGQSAPEAYLVQGSKMILTASVQGSRPLFTYSGLSDLHCLLLNCVGCGQGTILFEKGHVRIEQ
ncbi:hypothetical protein DFH28DRAFT_925832 [Melampsora americana]|nr:hypothetical protein DFH28DRAFT_925832 [Melampsora americana]